MKAFFNSFLFRVNIFVLILITLISCQNESKTIDFSDIKNEYSENKVKTGYWIEYRNQNSELQNEPKDAVLFRVIEYKNGYPKGEVIEYLPKDSTKYASYKIAINEPNTIYKFNAQTYTDTVFYYDKYGTPIEKNYFYNDSLRTKLISKFNFQTSKYETRKIILNPDDDFETNLTKLRGLEKYFSDSDKELWGELWDSKLSGEENTENIFTIEYPDGRKQSFEEKKQIFEQLISSAEANRVKRFSARFSGGTLRSLKRCRKYNDFVNWINGWEKSYTSELNKVYKLKNSSNRVNKAYKVLSKYATYSDGLRQGPVRVWVTQLASNQDLAQNLIDKLERKIEKSYDKCGDLYSKCINK